MIYTETTCVRRWVHGFESRSGHVLPYAVFYRPSCGPAPLSRSLTTCAKKLVP